MAYEMQSLRREATEKMFEEGPKKETTVIHQEPKRSIWAPILGAGLVAVSGFSLFQYAETQDLRQEMSAYQRDVAALRTNLSGTDGELQKTLNDLRQQLATSQELNKTNLTKSQTAARRQAASLITKLEQQQADQAKTQEELTAELNKVREANTEASTKISGVSTEVQSVKTEVASAKSEIEKTLSDLTRVRGDLGVMSGLIATNSKEIGALRELGDRNIYEFTLAKTKELQRVGDIQVKLKKADQKRNRYTMEIMADDKLVEKKDRNTNEPVQFYVVSKARQPYEIVVNQVNKDEIKGYLATPKVSSASSTRTN